MAWKKIMFLAIAVLFSGISFQACKKEYCWKCVTTSKVFTAGSTTPAESESTTQVCDKTTDDIKQIEKDGTYVTQSTSGGQVIMTTSVTTKCNR